MGEKTKKIITLDIKELISDLNKALADEFLAAYQYLIGSKIVKGINRKEVQDELEEHAKEEYDHAIKLIDRIIQLDGTPILEPQGWYTFTNCGYITPKDFDTASILKQNITGERCAIDVYSKLAKKLKDKDDITYEMILGILNDEITHECDLQTILEDIEHYL